MTDSISSSFPSFSSLALQMTELKAASVSTLLSGGDSSIAGFTQTVCDAHGDLCSISSVSRSVNAVVKAAESSGVSADASDNVRVFAAQMQEEGYDTLSILEYLEKAEALAQSDPDLFTRIFSASNDAATDDTLSAMDGDGADEE